MNSSNEQSDGTPTNMKTLLLNRNRPLYTAYDPQQDTSNEYPNSMQRRSSFQVATKLNSLDISTMPETYYVIDKPLIKRNHYSPEHYRDKRRDHSKTDINRQSNLIMENQMIKDEYIINDKKSPEINSTYESNRKVIKDDKNFILNHDDHYRDDGIFV